MTLLGVCAVGEALRGPAGRRPALVAGRRNLAGGVAGAAATGVCLLGATGVGMTLLGAWAAGVTLLGGTACGVVLAGICGVWACAAEDRPAAAARTPNARRTFMDATSGGTSLPRTSPGRDPLHARVARSAPSIRQERMRILGNLRFSRPLWQLFLEIFLATVVNLANMVRRVQGFFPADFRRPGSLIRSLSKKICGRSLPRWSALCIAWGPASDQARPRQGPQRGVGSRPRERTEVPGAGPRPAAPVRPTRHRRIKLRRSNNHACATKFTAPPSTLALEDRIALSSRGRRRSRRTSSATSPAPGPPSRRPRG